MFRIDSDDRWHWREDVFIPLDFCVRALRIDGLRVPPFDRHPDGDHSLRERGMTESRWRRWVESMLDARTRLDPHVRNDRWLEDLQTLGQPTRTARSPAALGTTELQAMLEELWNAYEPEGERWKRRMTEGRRHDWFGPRYERWLWNALVPFHRRLETLSVYLVDYPEPAILTVPPTSCLIGQDSSTRDGAAYATLVLRAAQELAGLQAG